MMTADREYVPTKANVSRLVKLCRFMNSDSGVFTTRPTTAIVNDKVINNFAANSVNVMLLPYLTVKVYNNKQY